MHVFGALFLCVFVAIFHCFAAVPFQTYCGSRNLFFSHLLFLAIRLWFYFYYHPCFSGTNSVLSTRPVYVAWARGGGEEGGWMTRENRALDMF